MNQESHSHSVMSTQPFFLSEVLKVPVLWGGRKIGRLQDFLIVDRDKAAEVTHLIVSRPFGDSSLVVPWEKVAVLGHQHILINIDGVEAYAVEPAQGSVFLRDYILDKKVLDGEDHEIEVVYDVKLALNKGRLYVIEVDLSKNGLLRRLGLKWLADFTASVGLKIGKQTVGWSYVEPLSQTLGSFKGDLKLKVLKDQLEDIPSVDLADILEELNPTQRVALFDELDVAQASDTLEELEPNVQRDLIASLEKGKTAQLINEMTPGQAADILSVLPWPEVTSLLELLNPENAAKIKYILEKQEERIADFAVTNFLRFAPEKTALQARRTYQRAAKGKEAIMYLYILDPNDKLMGVIDIKELLMAEDEVLLKDFMTSKVVSLTTDSTLKQAAEMFARYSFRALPLADKEGKMLGVVTYRDVMNLKHLFY